ncbi:hypothetical protein [Methylobacterium sp. NEAU K]|uniref:hypothetical protein n=1 Tax=Methylobacterium sp. NEAU K TaxID=3064946 RepID=UPI0027337404|nr:hypothetical protein [Methylobacterium sp. NEAU K]MDP4006215.1 hypothetical protein [Methylobacterium sp. NEAU K]
MKTLAPLVMAAAFATSVFTTTAADARVGYRGHRGYHPGYSHRGRHRYYRLHRNSGVAGAVFAGTALGLINAAIAASWAPRYYPYGYYGPYYNACYNPYCGGYYYAYPPAYIVGW